MTTTSPIRLPALAEHSALWEGRARNVLTWRRPFLQGVNWSDPPFATWFADGELNVSENCLDRHVAAGIGDRIAIYWEGEPGDRVQFTYRELLAEVCRAANAFATLGIGKGDRVVIYLPLIPEAIIAMLACARIGAIHSVVFAGFSPQSLRARVDDAGAKLVITADGGIRKGKVTPLKGAVDEALTEAQSVEHVLVVQRTSGERGERLNLETGSAWMPEGVGWRPGRDMWWHEVLDAESSVHEPEAFAAETPLFILYTSGTTGAPKGIVHTSAGYLTQAVFTHSTVFDLRPESDVYWCTADVGWITGHSYVVYGPLANGATQVIYEGAPDTPHHARWWELVERYRVSIFYTAPTAIRTFMRLGRQLADPYDLSSLRVLGSVGEPINPEAWEWFRDNVGGGGTPVIDTWWQTETGAVMAAPGVHQEVFKPGSVQHPVSGVHLSVVRDDGTPTAHDEIGFLVAELPWPSMARGIWGDPDRFVDTYWSRFPGRYFTGDSALVDSDGDLWLRGRVDDVMNVAGHRLSTAEIEATLGAHPYVAESAVVGAFDEKSGQAVVAFVVLKDSQRAAAGEDAHAVTVLRTWVRDQIGAIASPRQILVVPDLPKTRSGKIMRRLLRNAAEDRPVGDVTTLSDTSIMAVISARLAAGHTED